jgi:DnaJ-class molecular chaperone
MDSSCLYTLLGVERDASNEEIRKAYRKKALESHPDKNENADAGKRFIEVARAYKILSDNEKRKIYDRFGERGLEKLSILMWLELKLW